MNATLSPLSAKACTMLLPITCASIVINTSLPTLEMFNKVANSIAKKLLNISIKTISIRVNLRIKS